MNSIERYQGFASMAETARDIAKTGDEWTAQDQRWAAFSTAARHAMLADRWARRAAADQTAAARGPVSATGMAFRAPDPRQQADLDERAARSAKIAAAHRAAAEKAVEEAEGAPNNGSSNPAPAPAPSSDPGPSTLTRNSRSRPMGESNGE